MNNLSFFNRYKIYFAGLWLLLFITWYFLRADDYATSRTAFLVTIIKVADLALMVCLCNYLLIPKLLYRKKYALFFVCFAGLVIISSLLKMQLLGRVMNNAFLMDWNIGWKRKIYDNIIPHFFLVIAGAAIKLMIDATRMQRRITAMAKEKAEAELEFLRQQINPHFLFNSLNTVYFQIDKSNTEARDTLHQLSEMLRYQLYETRGAAIPIEKEIKYLQDYIALQKMRKEEHYKISLRVSASTKGFLIEPFLLIPFVENCFKHISHYNETENTILVSLDYLNSVLFFKAINSTEPPVNNPKRTGIGMPNVKRRLELLYPGRHKLCIENTEGNYMVALQLKIKEHEY